VKIVQSRTTFQTGLQIYDHLVSFMNTRDYGLTKLNIFRDGMSNSIQKGVLAGQYSVS